MKEKKKKKNVRPLSNCQIENKLVMRSGTRDVIIGLTNGSGKTDRQSDRPEIWMRVRQPRPVRYGVRSAFEKHQEGGAEVLRRMHEHEHVWIENRDIREPASLFHLRFGTRRRHTPLLLHLSRGTIWFAYTKTSALPTSYSKAKTIQGWFEIIFFNSNFNIGQKNDKLCDIVIGVIYLLVFVFDFNYF